MKKDLVSIIIPVYNGSNFVREAIDSALAQTYENIEIIVVNDGSKDNEATEKICLSYGGRIRYIRKENGGVSTALNLGIKEMKGEWFSWLSHDDKYEPDKIEKQIDALSQYDGNVQISLCECKCINAQSQDIYNKLNKNRFSSSRIIPPEEMLENLLIRGCFSGCALLINRKVFEKCGYFNEQLRYSQDLLLWYKIFLNGFETIYLTNLSVCKRIHNAQVSQTGRALFYRDSSEVAREIAPLIIQNTIGKNRLLYLFSRAQAVYNCKDALNICLGFAERANLFTSVQKFKLKATLLYGKIRPIVRRFFYKVFYKMVTQ
ncbi:MAG: glycosyltransferase [Fibrobacter sp.]|uniref:glycosyltransferase family 2 protein n=1 Tax=Fibrobacter sp. TaxID=35828 RepID=UPI0025C29AC5|nr:glycosyltransferase [Fibrobacter sp.]MBQ7080895.1 glycosyltransferase [Fibrobacter sp.]